MVLNRQQQDGIQDSGQLLVIRVYPKVFETCGERYVEILQIADVSNWYNGEKADVNSMLTQK